MNVVDRLVAWWEKTLASLRHRFGWFDHIWRAKDRYGDVHAGRLAAAISYYGFFAAFALAMLAYAILGYLLDNNETVAQAVTEWLQENLPFLNAAKIQGSRHAVGVVGLVGFLFTGIGWVEAMRSSIRAVWLIEQHPGNYFVRRGMDVVVLVGLGLLLGASIAFSVGAQNAIAWLREYIEVSHPLLDIALNGVSVLVVVCINWVLAAAMLTGLPRLRMPLARWLPAGLLVAVGLELLKTVGQFFIVRTERNPAYQVVVGAVGLLIFLNLFNQLLLWASALAATSDRGHVRDLAAGPGDAPPGGSESASVTEG